MQRRMVMSALALMPALAACTQTPGGGVVLDVSISALQSEAQAVLAALDQIATNVMPSLASGAQSAVNTALAGLKAAVNSFLGVSAGDAALNYAKEIINGVSAVIAVLPIPAGVMMYLTSALLLFSAFVNGVPTVTVPQSVTVAPPAKLPRGMRLRPGLPRAPIPVPVS